MTKKTQGKYASEIEVGEVVRFSHYGHPVTGVIKEIQPSQKAGYKRITFSIGGMTETETVSDEHWFELAGGEE